MKPTEAGTDKYCPDTAKATTPPMNSDSRQAMNRLAFPISNN